MPITDNVGGVLYTLNTIHCNDGGVLHELATVHSNDDGVLHEIHSSWKRPSVIWAAPAAVSWSDTPWWSSGDVSDYIISDDYDVKSAVFPSHDGNEHYYTFTSQFSITSHTSFRVYVSSNSGNMSSISTVIMRDGQQIDTISKNGFFNSSEFGDYKIITTLYLQPLVAAGSDPTVTQIISYLKN